MILYPAFFIIKKLCSAEASSRILTDLSKQKLEIIKLKQNHVVWTNFSGKVNSG